MYFNLLSLGLLKFVLTIELGRSYEDLMKVITISNEILEWLESWLKELYILFIFEIQVDNFNIFQASLPLKKKKERKREERGEQVFEVVPIKELFC